MSSIEKFAFWVSTTIAFVCLIVIAILVKRDNTNHKVIDELNYKLERYKNIDDPSKGEIDSIKTNIIYKDSIITQIKIKYVEESEELKTMPDSAAVDLFYKLVWADEKQNR